MVLGWFPGLFPRLRMEVNLQSLVFRVEGQQMQALDERAAQVHRSTLWGLPKADAPFLALNLNHPTIVGMFHEYQPSNLGIPHFKKKNRFTIIDPLFLNLASYAEDAAFIEHFGLPGPRRFAHLWSICHKLRG